MNQQNPRALSQLEMNEIMRDWPRPEASAPAIPLRYIVVPILITLAFCALMIVDPIAMLAGCK